MFHVKPKLEAAEHPWWLQPGQAVDVLAPMTAFPPSQPRTLVP
jgi:hypothetical protein